jgi:hypothetical protein
MPRKLPRMGPRSRCEACNEVTPVSLRLRRVGLVGPFPCGPGFFEEGSGRSLSAPVGSSGLVLGLSASSDSLTSRPPKPCDFAGFPIRDHPRHCCLEISLREISTRRLPSHRMSSESGFGFRLALLPRFTRSAVSAIHILANAIRRMRRPLPLPPLRFRCKGFSVPPDISSAVDSSCGSTEASPVRLSHWLMPSALVGHSGKADAHTCLCPIVVRLNPEGLGPARAGRRCPVLPFGHRF